MAVIERSNPRKRRRTVEPVTELQLPATKKSRSSPTTATKDPPILTNKSVTLVSVKCPLLISKALGDANDPLLLRLALFKLQSEADSSRVTLSCLSSRQDRANGHKVPRNQRKVISSLKIGSATCPLAGQSGICRMLTTLPLRPLTRPRRPLAWVAVEAVSHSAGLEVDPGLGRNNQNTENTLNEGTVI
jgi:hypothetical protein